MKYFLTKLRLLSLELLQQANIIVANATSPFKVRVKYGSKEKEFEVTPFLEIDDKVKQMVDLRLLPESLIIIGLVPFNKENPTNSLEKNYYRKLKKDKIQRAIDDSICEFYRPMGNYERIFPLKTNINKYRKIFGIRNNEYIILLRETLINPTDKIITGD